jgi:hypothetical protein
MRDGGEKLEDVSGWELEMIPEIINGSKALLIS